MPASDSDLIIEAKGLKRSFKVKNAVIEAVRGVDLTVRKGEIVGFLGPNGAGKTTTLKMLTTLLDPTGGSATRLAGVTICRSITPARHSAMMPKPTNSPPKMPSWTSSPGTNTCQASPWKPEVCATVCSSGPNRVR